MNSMFGTKHIILLAISVVLIVLSFILSKNMKLKTFYKILLYGGIASEVIKVFYYIITNEESFGGYLPKTDLPFHLCSIQLILIAIYNFSKNEELKRNLLAFSLPTCLFGGIAAILIPTSSSLNGSFIITIQYFGYHVMIASFALYLFRCKDIKWEFKDYITSLKLLALIAFGAIYLNSILNDGTGKINFMYVVHPPQSGLPFLTEEYGWLVYIVHYALLAFFLITLIYIKPIISRFKKKTV